MAEAEYQFSNGGLMIQAADELDALRAEVAHLKRNEGTPLPIEIRVDQPAGGVRVSSVAQLGRVTAPGCQVVILHIDCADKRPVYETLLHHDNGEVPIYLYHPNEANEEEPDYKRPTTVVTLKPLDEQTTRLLAKGQITFQYTKYGPDVILWLVENEPEFLPVKDHVLRPGKPAPIKREGSMLSDHDRAVIAFDMLTTALVKLEMLNPVSKATAEMMLRNYASELDSDPADNRDRATRTVIEHVIALMKGNP